MSDALISQSSRCPNKSQRYDDDAVVAVVKSDLARWRNCRRDCRRRCGFDPRGWDHRLCTAATETRQFPQIRWVIILYGHRCRGAPANDGDAVQPDTHHGDTA